MLFAVLGGLFLAIGVHFALPHRALRGSALLPAVGTAATAIVWSALTWLGWPFDGGWIWFVSIAVSPLAAVAVGLALPKRRRADDDRLFETLAKG